MATTSSDERQTRQTMVHARALEEVFAEISTCPLPTEPGAVPAKVSPRTRPLHEPCETAVDCCTGATPEGSFGRNEPDRSGRFTRAVRVGCLLLGVLFFARSVLDSWPASTKPPSAAPATAVSFAPPSPVAGQRHLSTKRIEAIRLGERLAGRNPLREQVEQVEPDAATWRQVSLQMTKQSGLGLWIELLRPLAWIEEYAARPGSTIHLDLAEMGAVGDAQVTHVGPCPAIQPGAGTVVTGTFRHQVDEGCTVVHLRLEDQAEPTGVTANHPYWSEDRQAFVEAGSLRVGELVDTVYGRKHVVSITPIAHRGFVYNLETTEHVYRVGAVGALVHNSCAREIALGHDVPGGGYKELARQTGASSWRNWAADGITRRRVDLHFGRACHQAAQRAEKIHFALDGIDDVEAAVRAGKRGFVRHNMTYAELEYIVSNPDVLKKTIFYRNGQVVPSPF